MATTKKINIHSVSEIVKLAKMFEEKTGGELQCITLKSTDIKYVKNELSIHNSDIDKKDTVAFVMINNDKKFHLMWFKLVDYIATDFESWKMTNATIEYKNI
jgi:hypothetical protein